MNEEWRRERVIQLPVSLSDSTFNTARHCQLECQCEFAICLNISLVRFSIFLINCSHFVRISSSVARALNRFSYVLWSSLSLRCHHHIYTVFFLCVVVALLRSTAGLDAGLDGEAVTVCLLFWRHSQRSDLIRRSFFFLFSFFLVSFLFLSCIWRYYIVQQSQIKHPQWKIAHCACSDAHSRCHRSAYLMHCNFL